MIWQKGTKKFNLLTGIQGKPLISSIPKYWSNIFEEAQLFSYLSHRHVVVGPVKDRRVVVLVLDLDGDGADVLQGWLAIVAGLHRNVDQLLAVGLVSVKLLKIILDERVKYFWVKM